MWRSFVLLLIANPKQLSQSMNSFRPQPPDYIVTSQHILYYCTYYSLSLTCTVHCTIDIHTLYVPYMFPVSLFPILKLHLQHLFTTLVHSLSHSRSIALQGPSFTSHSEFKTSILSFCTEKLTPLQTVPSVPERLEESSDNVNEKNVTSRSRLLPVPPTRLLSFLT